MTAKVPRTLVVSMMAQDITTGIELLFWNEREFYENRVSRANAAAFLLHCGWTAPAGFSSTGVLALLIELCKKRFDEDLSEMASETGAGMTEKDPALQLKDGPQKERAKQLTDNLYNRVKQLYPDRKGFKSDTMLNPPVVKALHDSVRSSAQPAMWFNLFQLETYTERRRATGGVLEKDEKGNGRVTMAKDEYTVKNVNKLMPVAMENVKIVLLGLLAAFSFHIDSAARTGNSGYVRGYAERLFGTNIGIQMLDEMVIPMSMYFQDVSAYLKAWNSALHRLYDIIVDSKDHVDDAIEALVRDRNYFCDRSGSRSK